VLDVRGVVGEALTEALSCSLVDVDPLALLGDDEPLVAEHSHGVLSRHGGDVVGAGQLAR
jgi:hypothetical protein